MRILDIILIILAILFMYYTAAQGQAPVSGSDRVLFLSSAGDSDYGPSYESDPGYGDYRIAQTQIWLARAAIAEVGWPVTDEKKVEQAGVWYALETRWLEFNKSLERPVLYTEFIRLYCAGLGEGRPQSNRQQWLRELSWKGEKPANWPIKARWSKHKDFWLDTLKRAAMYMRGEIPNPCPGANHFGSLRAGDTPRGKMVLHICNYRFGTQFYEVVYAE